MLAVLQLSRSVESGYVINPDNNSSKVNIKNAHLDRAIGAQTALGGAAAGFAVGEYSRKLSARSDGRNNELFEEFWTREYKIKFVIDLLPELRAGFSFRYQSLESDLLGSYNLASEDRSRYKATMSGYALGLSYHGPMYSVGAFTAPPLRGKMTVEGEQKIVTDPGIGGLDLSFMASDRLNLGLTAMKFYYKRDDRDDVATSPLDQRDILLRGLDLDQYYRKTMLINLGLDFAVTPIVGIKANFGQDSGVFLFDASKVPGDNKAAETSVRCNELKFGVTLRNKQFFAELLIMKSSRSTNSIKVNRGDVNIRTVGDYKSQQTSNLFVLGGVF
ncbi:MAG: hypothetical protein NTX25_01025 [Proteobacteria bacterium]|nr:hypothetical protein [Pseudomonadota bacterium]